MNQIENNESIIWLQNHLEDWILNGQYSQEQMVSWLKGYELPPIGHEDEPYLWILRALKNLHINTQKLFAKYLSRFLAEIDLIKELSEIYQEKIFYNLFCLCSSLHYPEVLGVPLWNIFDMIENEKGNINLFFSKRFNIKGAFRGALISNQYARKYNYIWQNMLSGASHNVLQGNEYSGFEGIINFNKSDEKQTSPDTDEIGKSLKKMINYLERSESGEQRKNDFRYLLKRLKELWKSDNFWDQELLIQAKKWGFPRWAIYCFDTLAVELPKVSNDEQHFYIWDFFSSYLSSYSEKAILLSSPVPITEISLQGNEIRILKFIKTRIDKKRLECEINLDPETINQICDAELNYLVEDWTSTHKENFQYQKEEFEFIKELKCSLIKQTAANASNFKSTERALFSIAERVGVI